LEKLENCRLIVDNVEEAWRRIDFSSHGIEYHIAGDSGWLSTRPESKKSRPNETNLELLEIYGRKV